VRIPKPTTRSPLRTQTYELLEDFIIYQTLIKHATALITERLAARSVPGIEGGSLASLVAGIPPPQAAPSCIFGAPALLWAGTGRNTGQPAEKERPAFSTSSPLNEGASVPEARMSQ